MYYNELFCNAIQFFLCFLFGFLQRLLCRNIVDLHFIRRFFQGIINFAACWITEWS